MRALFRSSSKALGRSAGGLRALFPYVRRHGRGIVVGVICLVLGDSLALVPPWLTKEAIDGLGRPEGHGKLGALALAIAGVALLQAVFRYGWRTSLFGVARHVEYGLRKDLFGSLIGLDRAFFLRHPTGDLMSRCTNDLVAVQELIAFVGLLVVDSSFTILSCVALMLFIDTGLTMLALMPLPFLSICFMYFGRRVKARSLDAQARLGELTQEVQETLSGIRLVKAYVMEQVRFRSYARACKRYLDGQLQLARLRGLFYALLGSLVGCSFAVVLAVGGKMVAMEELSLGGFVAFNSYLAMLSWPMMSVGFTVNLLQRARASMERIGEILKAEPLVRDPVKPIFLGPSTPSLTLEAVGARYPGSDAWALKGISLSIAPGAWIGITGAVGSGKTTLLELIPRIQDPAEGRILLDGTDVRNLALAELRSTVALVAQEPFLFSESIGSNLCPGVKRPEPGQFLKLAEIASLERDLGTFPQGWETLIGDRGVMLSGGQRQRVALARALHMRPKILLLDDAFAHLDLETEIRILDSLQRVCLGVTVILVSHRASTLMRTQWVVVLREGRISEQGPPKELLARESYLKRMFQRQQILGALESMAKEAPA